MARYPTSVEDLETTSCFLHFQEMRESPRNTQKLVVDLQSIGSLAQSTSEYACSSKDEVDGSKRL